MATKKSNGIVRFCVDFAADYSDTLGNRWYLLLASEYLLCQTENTTSLKMDLTEVYWFSGVAEDRFVCKILKPNPNTLIKV